MKKVLFVTEATYLSTGYAVFAKQILDRLLDSGKYEVAELSVYGSQDNPLRKNIRWKNYPNLPDMQDEDQVKMYNSSPSNQFGEWRFEKVCLDFKPDIVISTRDFWMDSFIQKSTFRRLFKWIWMPTVDAMPQNPEWIALCSDADAVLTYSDWAIDVLRSQSDSINIIGRASPAAESCYIPMSRPDVREELGIESDTKIVGTVMRNQRRKQFPQLIEGFSEYLKKSNDTNTYLYLHTSYPDNGWDLAELFHRHEVSSRILMTYKCPCGHVEASHFNDSVKQCASCKGFRSRPCSVANGVDSETMAKIYNSFDLYIQAANSEGLGMSQPEAAACGIPVATVRYSAMEDIIKHLEAIPIEPAALYKEMETGCLRAVVSPSSIADVISDFFSMSGEARKEKGARSRELFLRHYDCDFAASKWMEAIDSFGYADWNVPAVIKTIDDDKPPELNNKDFVRWAVSKYLINYGPVAYKYFARVLQRDLNFGFAKMGKGGFLYSDMAIDTKPVERKLTRDDVLALMKAMAEKNNLWEKCRVGLLKLRDEKWMK
ncbi:MAG: glycosyltransferase [Roseovarius sp.]|jgi:glycosyltransferase involved in cell wall biosynthesis